MHSNRWLNWPVWDSSDSFHTENFQFTGSTTSYKLKTGEAVISILKDSRFIDIYKELFKDFTPNLIFEIGFFQGGMMAFLADMVQPKKIVGVDRQGASPQLLEVITKAGYQDCLDFVKIIDQGDADEIKSVLDAKFGEEPIDLIIDDCSHLHDNTKVCFENSFGYLKPGGKYIIEDWGWTHWAGEPWQSDASFFHNTPSMTNLIFEIIMVLGSNKGAGLGSISKIEIISDSLVVITRGPDLAYKGKLDLRANFRLAGRQAQLISAEVSENQGNTEWSPDRLRIELADVRSDLKTALEERDQLIIALAQKN